MYVPPAFAVEERAELVQMIRACPFAQFVTATPEGPRVTGLPMFLDETEGEAGVLYAHLARANDHWKADYLGEALAMFLGPDAYVTPSWYKAKKEHGKVVPTWNYVAVHARGPVEFFDDPDRLLSIVSRLTDLHEAGRDVPWAVTDAPEPYIRAQLRGIIGLRMPLTSLAGKRKLSQNRSVEDRKGVRDGMAQSALATTRAVAELIPEEG